MNNDRFTEFIANPDLLQPSDIIDLDRLIKEYPYFQLARVLHLYSLKKYDSEAFNQQLQESAIHIPDRKKLYNFLYHNQLASLAVPGRDTRSEIMNNEPVEFQFENGKPEMTIEEPVDKEISFDEKLEQELLEIDEILSGFGDERGKTVEFIIKEEHTEPKVEEKTSSFSLIDKFIEENPAFTPNKLDLTEKRDDISVNSIQEDETIVTETLAAIFEMQKLYEKAVAVYEKLILKFPEKSTYFASRITELKKNIK